MPIVPTLYCLLVRQRHRRNSSGKMFYRKDLVKWHHWGLFLAAILYVQVEKSYCEVHITSQPKEPKVGQTVTLHFEYEGKILMVNWYKGSMVLTSKNILTYNPDNPSVLTTGKQFDSRMKALADGSLQISNVTASDSGDYTLRLSITNSVADGTFHLTINSPAPYLHPTDGQPKGHNNSALIGIIIGSVVAVILVVVISILWYRRGCNKSKQTPVFMDDKSTEIPSPSQDISSKPQNNFNRRLPSIPPSTTVYQNEDNESFKENKEGPYTDLTYIYLSGSYHNLQSRPPNA